MAVVKDRRSPLDIARLFATRRMIVALLMGFSSGLPLLLTLTLLQAWLTERGISIKVIGLFALVGLPYTFKFAWSPLFDRYRVRFLGRRRGWLIVVQLLLVLSIVALGSLSAPAPGQTVGLLAITITALLVAFFSASQDTLIDTYRRESLGDDEQSLGASLYVWGYRAAMLFTGGVGLILAAHIPYRDVYYIMAAAMSVGITATLLAREPREAAGVPTTLVQAVIQPFVEFFRAHPRAVLILAFILLYKLGDAFASNLATPFYLKLGFSTETIGVVVKLFGFWALMAGVLVGGLLVVRLGIIRSLMVFGILQGASTASLAWLVHTGPIANWLAAVISLEKFADGMGTAALVGYMALLTDRRYTATQFALLTALASVARVILSSFTGFMADSLGWALFFIVCALAAIPGLALIPWLGKPTQESGATSSP